MIKVRELINELKAAYPGYRVARTVRKCCLPHYGYRRFAGYITEADAAKVRTDIGAAIYLAALDKLFSE